jgi:hypothetical protein
MSLIATGSHRRRIRDDPCTAIWRRFVDEYGSLWTFRLISLMNQSADVAKWPVRVMPVGFVDSANGAVIAISDLEPTVQKEVCQALRNTLRRFYSATVLRELEVMGQCAGDIRVT